MTIKELENYVLLTEQRLETEVDSVATQAKAFVASKSRNWIIAAGVAFVLLVVLFIVAFIKTTKVNDSYKGQIHTLDSTIKYQQTTIDALQRVNASQDSTIYQLDEAYKKNRPTETRIIHQYEKVNTDVHNLSNSQLDSELSKYDY
jgi:septal ring factor EnvC (AmiA/AmiB activator)